MPNRCKLQSLLAVSVTVPYIQILKTSIGGGQIYKTKHRISFKNLLKKGHYAILKARAKLRSLKQVLLETQTVAAICKTPLPNQANLWMPTWTNLTQRLPTKVQEPKNAIIPFLLKIRTDLHQIIKISQIWTEANVFHLNCKLMLVLSCYWYIANFVNSEISVKAKWTFCMI